MAKSWWGLVVASLALVSCHSRGAQSPAYGGHGGESSNGALTAEQLDGVYRTFAEQRTMLNRNCYEPELESQGKRFSAEAGLKIFIDQTGKVLSVELGENTIPTASFKKCLVDTVRTWEFPALASPTWFTYPVSFTPAY
jgi:hypothetical protein